MKRWLVGLVLGLTVVFLFTLPPAPSVAQTSPATPYTPPRTRDGHPDLQGIWQALNTAAWRRFAYGPRILQLGFRVAF